MDALRSFSEGRVMSAKDGFGWHAQNHFLVTVP
jgi:hypothetical protein